MTDTPSIEAFLKIAAERLGRVEGVKSCEVSRGRYTEAELGNASFKAPGLRIALAAIKDVEDAGNGEIDVTLRVGVALVTRDDGRVKRETATVRLLDRLMILLPANPWGLAWASRPERVDGVNAHTATIGTVGLQVFEIGFDQTIRVGAPDPLLTMSVEAELPRETDDA